MGEFEFNETSKTIYRNAQSITAPHGDIFIVIILYWVCWLGGIKSFLNIIGHHFSFIASLNVYIVVQSR